MKKTIEIIENGVKNERVVSYIPFRMYKCAAISDMEKDFIATQEKSIEFRPDMLKQNLRQRFVRALVKIFAPLL